MTQFRSQVLEASMIELALLVRKLLKPSLGYPDPENAVRYSFPVPSDYLTAEVWFNELPPDGTCLKVPQTTLLPEPAKQFSERRDMDQGEPALDGHGV